MAVAPASQPTGHVARTLRPTAKERQREATGRRTVERLRLSDRTAHLCHARVRNSSSSYSLSHPKMEQHGGAFLGASVALPEHCRCPTNPWGRQRVQRRQEARTARRPFLLLHQHAKRSTPDPASRTREHLLKRIYLHFPSPGQKACSFQQETTL